MTFEEVIELAIGLNRNFPRKNIESKVGLYAEAKMYDFYRVTYGIDISKMIYDVLAKFDLETIEKSTDKLPIIIQSFEMPALESFSKLSDLPLV